MEVDSKEDDAVPILYSINSDEYKSSLNGSEHSLKHSQSLQCRRLASVNQTNGITPASRTTLTLNVNAPEFFPDTVDMNFEQTLESPKSPLSPLIGKSFKDQSEAIDFLVSCESMCVEAPLVPCSEANMRLPLYQRAPAPNATFQLSVRPGSSMGPVMPSPLNSSKGLFKGNLQQISARGYTAQTNMFYQQPDKLAQIQYRMPYNNTTPQPTTTQMSPSTYHSGSRPFLGRKSDSEKDLNSTEKENKGPFNILICGYMVELPFPPYSQQKHLIDQLLRGLKKSTNCLLESPTGTGKTITLLSASLAWLLKEKADMEMLQKELTEENSGLMTPPSDYVAINRKRQNPPSAESVSSLKQERQGAQQFPHGTQDADSDEEDSGVFKSPKRRLQRNLNFSDCEPRSRGLNISEPGSSSRRLLVPEYLSPRSQSLNTSERGPHSEHLTLSQSEACDESTPSTLSDQTQQFRSPKIFYTTRTHSQIEQVISELKKSPYAGRVKMAILGSRETCCINPFVLTSSRSSINDKCQEVIEDNACSYYNCSSRLGQCNSLHSQLENRGLSKVYDIEEIVALGRRQRFCPYFTMRQTVKEADIIFCPYNYVIDPQIRESMNINISGSILIMDEAHNIENMCRETGSLHIEEIALENAEYDCQVKIRLNEHKEDYSEILCIINRFSTWLRKTGEEQTKGQGESDFVTPKDGTDLVIRLTNIHFDSGTIELLKKKMAAINEASDPDSKKRISGGLKRLCSSIINAFTFLFKPENHYKYNYYFTKFEGMIPSKEHAWSAHRGQYEQAKVWKYAFHLCCQMPSVVFEGMVSARSIIVASGTLSPINSFEGELGAFFRKIQGTAVTKPSNLFTCQISCGLKNIEFVGKYSHTGSLNYQDELGDVINYFVSLVPDGMLVFVPSYYLLDKLRKRWESTATLASMASKKTIFFEDTDKQTFEQSLQEYLTHIDQNVKDLDKGKGAIFFGVYRGKLAEGMDFSDAYARAVLLVGIPFPNNQNNDVALKMRFNDLHHGTLQLQNGHGWYMSQAFRALNQALGRCIRHKDDYGAIILIDARFCQVVQYQKSLPKWVVSKIQMDLDFKELKHGLQQFFAAHQRFQ